MFKFVMVELPCQFDEIKGYVKDKLMTKFYITPKLMCKLLEYYNLSCVFGLDIDVIKVKSRCKIDLMCTSVYNKFFQNDVIRVDGIKLNQTFCMLGKSIDDEDIIFGMEGEYNNYLCIKYEEL